MLHAYIAIGVLIRQVLKCTYSFFYSLTNKLDWKQEKIEL